MEYDDLELDTLGEQKTALFVIISDTDATFNFVVSIMYSQLFNLLCDKADDVYNGRLPVHVRMLLDEFANIGQLPQFEKLIATIRSREISASIILQSKSQLKAIYKLNIICEGKPKVAFICVHNSCRSQIAEALGKKLASDAFESYSAGTELKEHINFDAVRMMKRDHGIELTKETLIHSDQRCHYTSASFIQLVNDKELRQSMSRKGNCWDNAPQESFFGHMKDEIDVSGCKKYRDVKAIVDDWMEYYNSERYQWQLAKLSPDEYYGYITTGIYPLKGIINEREREHRFPKTN